MCRSLRVIYGCWSEFRGWLAGLRRERMLRGVRNLWQAIECDVKTGVQTEHVDQAHISVDVVRVLEKVSGIEGPGDMPPEAVASIEQPRDQFRRLADTVVFDIQDGVKVGEDLLRALEYAEFMALDIDFDEGDRGFIDQAVEWITRRGARRGQR